MSQVFGNYIEKVSIIHEFLALKFFPASHKVQERWRNNGLSADFMADYFATFFPRGTNEEGVDVQAEIKSAVSFIANELLENAMKFSDDSAHFPTSITLHSDEESLLFVATNSLSPERMSSFQSYLQMLTASDPHELYIEQMEKNAEGADGSGLGFLTMITDYSAEVGWKFETIDRDGHLIHCVITSVQIRF